LLIPGHVQGPLVMVTGQHSPQKVLPGLVVRVHPVL
jgi:hypothetical protein